MNSIGLNLILKMGCICSKERLAINGRVFLVRERLGIGGFSTVDLVEDTSTHEEFALKRITCHGGEDQRVAMAEVEFHRLFSHPGILEVIDYDLRTKRDTLGSDPTTEVLILLPYHHRGTLAAELERRERSKSYLPETEVCRYFLAILNAVQEFHNLSPTPLAHRDLKTANVLLDKNLNPVLMDLGSTAKARLEIRDSLEARKLEETAAERSSMPYRAPELFNIPSRTTIDERTDVWSLGCVLYALCYFKSPFDFVHERGDSVPLAIVSGRLVFPEEAPYSEDIKNLIRSILVVDPKERPFVQDLIQKVKQLQAKSQGLGSSRR